MFDISHEIRGQGGTFGFPVISAVADSLCKFLEPRKKLKESDLEIVKVHILAMRAVFRQGLRGPNPELEGELRNMLSALRERSS